VLSILNEQIGFYRRINEKEKAIKAANEAIYIIEENNLNNSVGAATVYINVATTMKAFDYAKESLYYFSRAEDVYNNNGKQSDYEYAALLNNKAASLLDLEMYADAKSCYNKAVEILKKEGKHDGDKAISFVSLAQLVFLKDSSAYIEIEEYLDLAWDYLNAPNLIRLRCLAQ